MGWLWVVGAVWLMLGIFVGALIGRGIRLADRKQAEELAAAATGPNFVVDLSVRDLAIPRPAPAPAIEQAPSPRQPEEA